MNSFRSCFRDKLDEYVTFRKTLGFSNVHHRCLLLFDEYCHTFHPHEHTLTSPLVNGWLKYEIACGRKSIENKQSAIRSFAKYLGGDAYILDKKYWSEKADFKPYILSSQELNAILSAADNLKKPKDPFFAETAGVILRLMYACGLRPTEARNLKRSHIDFDTGELFITKSKLSKDRIVVASTDMIELMKKYDLRRNLFCGNTEQFFIHTTGAPITAEQLTDLTRKCWENANPDIDPSQLPRLRPYDFRHLFASTVLQTWIDEGKNIYAQLPYLRAYMGHEDFRDTLYYIHILPERLLMSPKIDWEQIESVGLEDVLWSL